MKLKLKGKAETFDPRLDRIQDFDKQSKEYPIREIVLAKVPRSYHWKCPMVLDQGNEGACVGFGVTHELIARPSPVKFENVVKAGKWAKVTIYWEAQKIDPWPGGAYPGGEDPFYEGTSVLAGVKVAQKAGWFKEYRWSFSLYDLILGVGHNGPAVLGLNWYEKMYYPDNYYQIYPEGNYMGGHCILCNGVDVKKSLFSLHNSWGTGWGKGGECFISFRNMEYLLKMGGEAVFFLNRTIKPKGE